MDLEKRSLIIPGKFNCAPTEKCDCSEKRQLGKICSSVGTFRAFRDFLSVARKPRLYVLLHSNPLHCRLDTHVIHSSMGYALKWTCMISGSKIFLFLVIAAGLFRSHLHLLSLFFRPRTILQTLTIRR